MPDDVLLLVAFFFSRFFLVAGDATVRACSACTTCKPADAECHQLAAAVPARRGGNVRCMCLHVIVRSLGGEFCCHGEKAG